MRRALFPSWVCVWSSVWRVLRLKCALLIICEAPCRLAAHNKQPVGTRSKALKHVAYTWFWFACLQVPYIANVLNGAVLLEITLRIPDFLTLSQSSESFHYMETKPVFISAPEVLLENYQGKAISAWRALFPRSRVNLFI